MKNNIIEINEDSELNNLNKHINQDQDIKGKTKIYSFENIIKNKIFLIITTIFIICLFAFIIVIFFFKESSEGIILSSYDLRGIRIYKETGVLSFNKLNEIMYGEKLNYSKYNNIHIAMSFDNDYYLLTTVTLASLLTNADENTYIHIHIIAVENFLFSTMKKLNSLRYRLNNNSEFIFHNGSQAEIDFGYQIKSEPYGVGEYARLMSPELINDTDRILVMDSGDLFIERDLLELYNYPLEDKFIKGVIDPYTKCFPDYKFFKKENYFNGGVLLFNSKKWREMGIYQDIVKFYNTFQFKGRLPTPIQDILNTFFPSVATGIMPLRYNFQGFYDIEQEDNNIIDNDYFNMDSIYNLECSLYYQKKDVLIEEENNIAIRHNNKLKIHLGETFGKLKSKWIYYAKLTGFYKEICEKYPMGCSYSYDYSELNKNEELNPI